MLPHMRSATIVLLVNSLPLAQARGTCKPGSFETPGSFIQTGTTLGLQGLNPSSKEQCKVLHREAQSFLEIRGGPGKADPPIVDQPVFYCEDCRHMLNKMIEHCAKPENGRSLANFCDIYQPISAESTAQHQTCLDTLGCMDEMYCPHNPCDRLKHEASHNPMAICEHSCVRCSPCPAMKQADRECSDACKLVGRKFIDPQTGDECDQCSTKTDKCYTLPCSDCGVILGNIQENCPNPEFRDSVFTGYCPKVYEASLAAGHTKKRATGLRMVCDMIVKALNEQFWPEHFCDGLKCLCNEPGLNCPACGTLIACEGGGINVGGLGAQKPSHSILAVMDMLKNHSGVMNLATLSGMQSMAALAETPALSSHQMAELSKSLTPEQIKEDEMEMEKLLSEVARDSIDANKASVEAGVQLQHATAASAAAMHSAAAAAAAMQ